MAIQEVRNSVPFTHLKRFHVRRIVSPLRGAENFRRKRTLNFGEVVTHWIAKEKDQGSIPGRGTKNNSKLVMSSDGICKYLPDTIRSYVLCTCLFAVSVCIS